MIQTSTHASIARSVRCVNNMDIPHYPEFRPLELQDKAVFDAAFRQNPPENSEYTFTNLYCWRNAHTFSISIFDGLLIIASGKEYYPLIGTGDPRKAVKKILLETHNSFIRVPEATKALFDDDPEISVVFDRDNSDYLFLAQDLIRLSGRKYDGKRNFIKNFKAAHEYEYIQVTEAVVSEILRFQDIWCVQKGCSQSKSLLDESEAVKEMLAHLSLFKLKAGALRVEGKICAVCIAEMLNPETIVIHVLKAAQGIVGIYQTIFNDFLAREAGAIKFVNMEQDLGIAGLRKSKESYQPVRLIGKYTLRLSRDEVK
jgi:uncharacterized protein